ncbi:hypothetical protein, partial [Candidatus Venteria ishoeyi]|uniref:hypothetical protein n=1 Tax=Candidatus Venteria ishoeyi TaxID=1899563 RepID=UPI000AE0B6AA
EESLQYRRGYIPQLAVNSGKALSLIAGDIVLTQGGYHQAEIYELETKTVQQVVDFLPVPILAVSGGELNLITQQGTGEIILGNDAPSHVQPSGSFTLERAWLNVSGTPSSKIRLQTDKLLMSNGHIFAENRGVSPAGMIDIWAGDIQLDSSSITASTLSASGAPIHISAENLAIAKGISLSSTTIGEGKGGDIEIELEKEMRLSHSASFLTANFATGKAGNIHVQAQNIKVLDGGFISSSSIMGSGSGGTIQLQASDTVYLESEQYMGQASLSSMSIGDSIEAGTGGDIHVRARHIELVAGAGINTSTFGAGHGGNIQLQADSVRLTGKSQDAQAFPSYLSASSHSFFDDVPAGNAGRIHVQANKLSLEIGTNISTSASQATGGNIQLDINQQLYLHKSEINTSVFGGSGDGGNINIQQPRVAALNQGQIKAQADVGNGGNISIAADHFLSSQNSQINASSRLGIDGQVLIDTPDSYGSSSLLLTAGYFLQTTDLLPLDCAIHNDVLSRFGIKKAPHGTPTAPEDFIY